MNDYGNVNFSNKLPNEFLEAEENEFDDLLKIKNSLDKKLKELELKLKMQSGTMDEKEAEFECKHLRASVSFSLKRYGT